MLDFTGNVGIGVYSPKTSLDLIGALTQRGIAAQAVSGTGEGVIYFDSTANKFKVSQNGGGYTDLVYSGGGTTALSSLSAATTTNTIDNLNFAQAWTWTTATTENPMTLSAASLTTGSLLSLNANALTTGSLIRATTSSDSVNSTNGLLYVGNTSAATTGTIARIQANLTAGSGLTVLATGDVGVGY
jgi:hypothetical protein